MGKTTANIEIKVSNARITEAKAEVLENGTCKLTIESDIKDRSKIINPRDPRDCLFNFTFDHKPKFECNDLDD